MADKHNPAEPRPHGNGAPDTATEHNPRNAGVHRPAAAGSSAGPLRTLAGSGDASHLTDGPITPPASWTISVANAKAKHWSLVDGQECTITYNGEHIVVYAQLNSARTMWTLTYVSDG